MCNLFDWLVAQDRGPAMTEEKLKANQQWNSRRLWECLLSLAGEISQYAIRQDFWSWPCIFLATGLEILVSICIRHGETDNLFRPINEIHFNPRTWSVQIYETETSQMQKMNVIPKFEKASQIQAFVIVDQRGLCFQVRDSLFYPENVPQNIVI